MAMNLIDNSCSNSNSLIESVRIELRIGFGKGGTPCIIRSYIIINWGSTMMGGGKRVHWNLMLMESQDQHA